MEKAHRSWTDLRAPVGGVRVARRVDPADELRTTMIDMFVREYGNALRSHDSDAAGRLVTARRELARV